MSVTPSLIVQYGFLAVALAIFAGESCIPILVPGELLLLLAGSQLVPSLPMLGAAVLGLAAIDLAATCLLHLAARSGGNRLLRLLMWRFGKRGQSPEQTLAAWRSRLGRHDTLAIFVIRCVPGIRISAAIGSGLLRIRFRRFVAGAAPAALLWVGVPLGLGYALRGQVHALMAGGSTVALVAGSLVLVLTLVLGGRWWVVRQRGGAQSSPTAGHTRA